MSPAAAFSGEAQEELLDIGELKMWWQKMVLVLALVLACLEEAEDTNLAEWEGGESQKDGIDVRGEKLSFSR